MSGGVALDARVTSHMSAGMIAYTRELARRLPLLAPELPIRTFGRGDNFDLAEQFEMPLWIAQQKPALVHYPTPFAPVVNPRPYIITIHDLIELRYPALSKGKAAPYYRYVTGMLARRAARVICDDERTRDDLVHLLRVNPDRLRVIPLGVDEPFLRPCNRSEPPRPYLLYVGNHRAHKDLPTLFSAWAQLPRDCAIDLHLTGPDDFNGALEPFRRDDARILFLGELDTLSLVEAYCAARALVHPSLIEGFGLPLLEASVLGVPVIAARSSVPRILDGIVAVYEAGDAAALGELLESVVRDPREPRARAQRGADVARTYTWQRCAAATLAVYHELLPA